MIVYLLDVVGTFAFAYFGAQSAQPRAHLLRAVVCGCITALGGGTIRELLLGHLPAYIHDPLYLLACILGIGVATIGWKQRYHLDRYFLLADAIGLVTFAYIGAQAASHANLGVAYSVGFAILSAGGGGTLSDFIIGRQLLLWREPLYVLPAAVVGCFYGLFSWVAHQEIGTLLLLGMGYTLRCGLLLLTTARLRPATALAPKNFR